jgi:serine/threonine protein kinase
MNRARFKPGDHVLLGDTFFRVELVMGVGGMGSAYRVVDNLNVQYVLKVMHTELARVPEYRRSFKWEARVGARIRSVHLVRVRRLGTLGDAAETPYFLMDYVPGLTIRDLQRNSKRLRLDQVLNMCGHVLQGLEVLHDHGIVHQDIKPANVILTKVRGEQIAKILDLGVIRVQRVQGDKRGWAGTPPYSAPEQILGLQIGPQTDLFAVGVMLYELLTGERPYPGNTEMDAIRRAHIAAPTLKIYGGCPPSVVKLVAKALSLRPEDRFASASDMADAIETIVAELDPVDPQLLSNTMPDINNADSSPSLTGQSRPMPIMEADLDDPTSPAGVDVERIRWHLAAASDAARGEPPKINPYALTEPGRSIVPVDPSTLLAGKVPPLVKKALPAAGAPPPPAPSPGTAAPPSPGTAVMPPKPAIAPGIAMGTADPDSATTNAVATKDVSTASAGAVGAADANGANGVRTKGGQVLTPAMRTEPMRAPFNPEAHEEPAPRTAMIQKPAAGNPANKTTLYWGQQRATTHPQPKQEPNQEPAAMPVVLPGPGPVVIGRSISTRNSIPSTFGVFYRDPEQAAAQTEQAGMEVAEEEALEPSLPWFRKWVVVLKKRWRKAARRRREVREIKREEKKATDLAKKQALRSKKIEEAADKISRAEEAEKKEREAMMPEKTPTMDLPSTKTKLVLSTLTGLAAGLLIFVCILYYFTFEYNQHQVKSAEAAKSIQQLSEPLTPTDPQESIQTKNSPAEKGTNR